MKNLILLHGALGDQQQFKALKSLLAPSFNVFTLNFAGHGGTPPDHEFSMDQFSEEVLGLMEKQGLSSASIFGYSMGGYVALNLASKHPLRVEKIITLGTKFNWTPESAAQETKMLNPDKILEKVPRFAEQLQQIHADHWRGVLDRTAQMMIGLGNGKRLKDEALSKIQQAVLIGIGDADKMVSIDESKQASDLLPNGQLTIIPGFRHPIEKVDQEELASIIIRFIG